MGYYINPKDMSKEEWLQINGHEVGKEISWKIFNLQSDHCLPVCLVNNGAFTAAAVCFSVEEFKDFSNAKDVRAKQWFVVPITKLLEVGAIV